MAESTRQALFICYSHSDEKYREQFDKFLKSESLKNIDIFSDAKVDVGDDWQKVILDRRLSEAGARRPATRSLARIGHRCVAGWSRGVNSLLRAM
jgi:hypothetical protein